MTTTIAILILVAMFIISVFCLYQLLNKYYIKDQK